MGRSMVLALLVISKPFWDDSVLRPQGINNIIYKVFEQCIKKWKSTMQGKKGRIIIFDACKDYGKIKYSKFSFKGTEQFLDFCKKIKILWKKHKTKKVKVYKK
jgi:hypothetical protein